VKLSAAAVLLLAAGCGNPGETPRSAEDARSDEPAGKPRTTGDAEAMFGREAGDLSEKSVTGPRNAWTARVSASGTPEVEQGTGFAMVEIPVGSEEPVRCQVFGNDIDAGGALSHVFANAGRKVQLKKVLPWSVQVVGDTPAAFIDALYSAKTEKGDAIGQLKVAIHPAAGHPVLCIHDEVGYRKTFERITTELCESFKLASGRPPEPAFVEVQSARIGAMPVGFEKRVLVRTGKEREMTTVTTMMLPTKEGLLQLIDDYRVEHIDEENLIARGAWVQAIASRVTVHIELERVKPGLYKYGGELKGKKVSGELQVKVKGLPSSLASAQRLAEQSRKPDAFTYTEPRYWASVDPGKTFDVRYFRNKGEPPQMVHIVSENTEVVGELDEQGLLERAEMPVGAAKVTFRRDFVRGKI